MTEAEMTREDVAAALTADGEAPIYWGNGFPA
jgi:hypothetical protein